MSVFVVVPRFLHVGVISSQVISMLDQLKVKNITILLPDKLDQIVRPIIESADNEFNILKYTNWWDLFIALRSAQTIYVRHYETFIIVMFLQVFSRFSKRIVYDFRSLLFIESWFRNKSILRMFVLFCIEFAAYKLSAEVCCVSSKLKMELTRRFGVRKIGVYPCGIKDTKRKKWKKPTSLRFVYCGSLEGWQCFDKVLEAYKSILVESNIKVSLSVFTNDVDSARLQAHAANVELEQLRTLKSSEVLAKMEEFDFGFVFRENILVNNVSSPIKFLEYTSRGVIPVISNGVGDFSDDVLKYKIGCLVDNFDPQFSELYKLRCDHEIFDRLFKYSERFIWSSILKDHPLKLVAA
jgi:hypothetical protein